MGQGWKRRAVYFALTIIFRLPPSLAEGESLFEDSIVEEKHGILTHGSVEKSNSCTRGALDSPYGDCHFSSLPVTFSLSWVRLCHSLLVATISNKPNRIFSNWQGGIMHLLSWCVLSFQQLIVNVYLFGLQMSFIFQKKKSFVDQCGFYF